MRYLFLAATIFAWCFLITACAVHQNQGKIVRSFEVTQLVESGIVLPDHTYFYTGPEVEPEAIIAIDNRFTLKSKYWIKVDAVVEKLNDWNQYIDNSTRYAHAYNGALIMTPDGQKAGIWYSRYDHTVVRYPDGASIVVYTPYAPVRGEKPFTIHRSP